MAKRKNNGAGAFILKWLRNEGVGIARQLAVLLSLASVNWSSHAQTVYAELSETIRSARSVTNFEANLFGEQVNLYTGSVEFHQTDFALQGNSSLPVSVGRSVSVGSIPNQAMGHFGYWDLEIPHIHGIFSQSGGWIVGSKTYAQRTARCSQFDKPPQMPGSPGSSAGALFEPGEYWYGTSLYVPGHGDQELLQRYGSGTVPADGLSYPITTASRWMMRCITGIANPTAYSSTTPNDSGEGFIAVSPEGVTYRFDWMVRRQVNTASKPQGTYASLQSGDTAQLVRTAGPSEEVPSASQSKDSALMSRSVKPPEENLLAGSDILIRHEYWMLPTQITDRFGNTVTYTYDATNPWRLLSIVANDGRRVDFTYQTVTYTGVGQNTHFLSTAKFSDGISTYTYTYSAIGGELQVTRPDGSAWSFTDIGLMTRGAGSPSNGDCDPSGGTPESDRVGIMRHPSGAIGTFTISSVAHSRSYVEKQCLGNYGATHPRYPKSYVTRSLINKKVSGPGISDQIWTYGYISPEGSWSDCTGLCPATKTSSVTAPDGSVTNYTFGTHFMQDEGLLLKTEDGYSSGAALRTTTFSYRKSNGTWLDPVGTSVISAGDVEMAARWLPMEKKVVSQQGASFTLEVAAGAGGFDSWARPLSVTRSSSLGASRVDTTTYADNTSLWVLDQISHINSGVLELQSYSYNAKAQPTASFEFGVLRSSRTYNTDGTLATVADGAGHSIGFSNYKRGIPRNVSYPTGATQSAVVNDRGLITSMTDAAGYTTGYVYDSMGRLASIAPTAGFNATTIAFEAVTSAEYGLPAGHWRQTITKGNGRSITYFDARWRPVMTRTFDTGNEANTRKVIVRAFDFNNKPLFVSIPQRDATSVAITSPGTRSQYDSLGRHTRTDVDSELGQLTTAVEYLSGFQTRTTNPRGYQSTQSFWALDDPNSAQLAGMSAPEGVSLTIARDIFGKPSSITRSGGGKSLIRAYVYDSGQRLCKTVEPEVGATIQTYDAASNILWRAPGQTLTSTSNCNDASVAGHTKITYGYDNLNRVTSTNYGDSSPNITRTYKPDGLPATIVSNGSTWTYDYNGLRQLTTETFNYAGSNYTFTHNYNPSGDASSLVYPGTSPITVAYNPNALGEPTTVGGYASSIAFHPNGAVSGYTLGNTIAHSLTLNTRGLPWVNQDAGVIKDSYSYDANGNVSGITDQQESLFSRAMLYDGLDRLTTANAPGVWGNGSYTYDALDNLLTANVGSRSTTLTYNATTNLLSSLNVSGTVSAIGYDARGNVLTKGGQGYTFDLGNRMSSATLGGNYSYDGDGRRFKVVSSDGSTRLSLYSQAGQLLWSTSTGGTRPTSSTAYIYLGSKQIAEWNSVNGTQYVHTDALGSPVAHTNASGALMNRTRFEAYGFVAQGTKPGAGTSLVGYTGHVQDAETDLVYMQQRYYDPIAGRFLSVDPIVTDANTGKGFGLYTYVDNNPYAKIDPDGRDPEFNRWADPKGLTHDEAQAGSRMAGGIALSLIPGVSSIEEGFKGNYGAAVGMLVVDFTPAKAVAKIADVAKTITLSKAVHGEAAVHAADAIKAGQPSVLTIDRAGASANREASIGSLDKVSGKHLDEYPPAMFSEGGAGASVRPINPRDNMSAGACIGNACRSLPNGSKVEIKVEN